MEAAAGVWFAAAAALAALCVVAAVVVWARRGATAGWVKTKLVTAARERLERTTPGEAVRVAKEALDRLGEPPTPEARAAREAVEREQGRVVDDARRRQAKAVEDAQRRQREGIENARRKQFPPSAPA